MKVFSTIIVGVISSFGLTILIEMAMFSEWMPRSVRPLYLEFPAVALLVGILLGLIAREKAKMGAAISLSPWAIWLVLDVNKGHSPVGRWAWTVAILSACIALSIGAAAATRTAVKALTSCGPERT